MKNSKKKKFLQLPTYPGGREAYQKFVLKNLVYPKEALENKIEGVVYIEYEVNDNGYVINISLTKGIGYGCDEEALRIAKLLRFDKAKNRGVRVKSRIKAKIEFKLPTQKQTSVSINYTVKTDIKSDNPAEKEGGSYEYSIGGDE